MRRANHQSQTDVKYSYRESTTNGPLSVAEKLQLNSHQSRRNKSEKNANRQRHNKAQNKINYARLTEIVT